MDAAELKKQFDSMKKKLKKAVPSDSPVSLMLESIFSMNNILFDLFKDLSRQNKDLSKQNKELNAKIEKLLEALANKGFTARKRNSEALNGKGSEKNKGIDSADHERKATKPKVKTEGKVESEDLKVYLDQDGTEISHEKAIEKVGTIITRADGKRYKYTRISESAHKKEVEVKVKNITYYRLELVEVDENDEPIKDATGKTIHPMQGINARADFLKKTDISISLFSTIVYEWLSLKLPLNRVAQHLTELGLSYSRQQLYSYVDQTAKLLRPVFDYLVKRAIQRAKVLGVDETFYSCNEKIPIRQQEIEDKEKQSPPPEEETTNKNQKVKRKAQRSKAVTRRSYLIGIVSDEACLYFHALERQPEFVKNTLTSNGITKDCFVESDAYYRGLFELKTDENGKEVLDSEGQNILLFQHGLCFVHVKRNFCELINFATTKDGAVIDEFKQQLWEQDVTDAISLRDKISNAFAVFNQISEKCSKDNSLDIVELKHKELKPLIDEIITEAKTIHADIKDGKRKCSERLKKAVGYVANNAEHLTTFIDSQYGVMHNNMTEANFRDFDILRNSCMASDTANGADNLAQFYSFYRSCKVNNINFKAYIEQCITTMMNHYAQIEFEKKAKIGTIIGYKSHQICDDVLEELMPWHKTDRN